MPGADGLSAICRAENVSISWLLTGAGAPYIVAQCADDDDALDYFNALMEESGWDITIMTDGDRFALVLYRPGSFETSNGKTVEYPILEIISNVGPFTLKAVRGQAKTSVLDEKELSRLITGWAPNARILEYLARATEKDIHQIAEAEVSYDVEIARLVRLFKTLPTEDRDYVLSWMESLSNNLLLRCIHEVENALDAEGISLPRDEVMRLAQKVYAQARELGANANQVGEVINMADALANKR